MSDRHWYLFSYDIRDPKRWRKVHKIVNGYGERLQYSLFRCHLTAVQMEHARHQLEQKMAEEDDLLIIRLSPPLQDHRTHHPPDLDRAAPSLRCHLTAVVSAGTSEWTTGSHLLGGANSLHGREFRCMNIPMKYLQWRSIADYTRLYEPRGWDGRGCTDDPQEDSCR